LIIQEVEKAFVFFLFLLSSFWISGFSDSSLQATSFRCTKSSGVKKTR